MYTLKARRNPVLMTAEMRPGRAKLAQVHNDKFSFTCEIINKLIHSPSHVNNAFIGFLKQWFEARGKLCYCKAILF